MGYSFHFTKFCLQSKQKELKGDNLRVDSDYNKGLDSLLQSKKNMEVKLLKPLYCKYISPNCERIKGREKQRKHSVLIDNLAYLMTPIVDTSILGRKMDTLIHCWKKSVSKLIQVDSPILVLMVV